MKSVEIDFVVKDSLAALVLYEAVFEVERVEVTAFPAGQNEAVFTIYGARFHMLDESPELGMVAPQPDGPWPVWFNVTVPSISDVYGRAMAAGCRAIQPVTEMADFGVSNAMFVDPFGHLWMLHEVHRVVSFEERTRLVGGLSNAW